MGWNASPNSATNLFEAFVTPYGTSSAEKQKIERFKSRFVTVEEFDNVPLPGFTLHAKKLGRGGNDTEWVIIDPRGVLVTISSSNLTSILKVTGITEGLIQEKCVWAREDSATTMILLPISSATYAEAVENTEMIADRVAMTDVQIGDTVLLQNKLQGTYCGSLSLYSKMDSGSGTLKDTLTAGKLLRRQVIEIAPNQYHYKADAKILQVIKRTDAPMTKQESAAMISAANEKIPAYFSSGTYFTKNSTVAVYNKIEHISSYAVDKVGITLEDITDTDAKSLILTAYDECDPGRIVLEDAQGKQFLLNISWYSRSGAPTSLSSIKVTPIATIGPDRITLAQTQSGRSYHYSSRPEVSHPIGHFTKFYKIVKHIKQEIYN